MSIPIPVVGNLFTPESAVLIQKGIIVYATHYFASNCLPAKMPFRPFAIFVCMCAAVRVIDPDIAEQTDALGRFFYLTAVKKFHRKGWDNPDHPDFFEIVDEYGREAEAFFRKYDSVKRNSSDAEAFIDKYIRDVQGNFISGWNEGLDELIPLFEKKVEVFKEKLEDLIENFDEKYLISPSEHNNLGLIFCTIVFFIFIYHFVLKKQTRFVVFHLKRLKLTQKQVGERVDQLFTGFNTSLVLIVLYSLCIQSLSYQTVMDSLDTVAMILLLKISLAAGAVLLFLRSVFQWFGVSSDEPLYLFVHMANLYLFPLIDLLSYVKVYVQVLVHLVFPGKSIPPSNGSGSLSLGIVFYLTCFTFLQTHRTEIFLDVLVSGIPDMSNLFLTNNDMIVIVGQNKLFDLIPLLGKIFPN